MPRDLRRRWVNQPSTLQPLHALHGRNVVADYTDHVHGEPVTVYLIAQDAFSLPDYPIASAEIPDMFLAVGWPLTARPLIESSS